MNIFILDKDPKRAAQMLCDKHCVKMILESAQLMCAHFEPGQAPYKRTHYNHPCSKWARQSLDNYLWLGKHAKAICAEYTARYGKIHKSEAIINWCLDNVNKVGPKIPSLGLTPFIQAMPDQYKCNDAIEAYRAYYIGEKSEIAKYAHSERPEWFM